MVYQNYLVFAAKKSLSSGLKVFSQKCKFVFSQKYRRYCGSETLSRVCFQTPSNFGDKGITTT